jgi:hypothetical protein
MAARAQQEFDDGAEAFKDIVFDLGTSPATSPKSAALPPLRPEQFADSMRGRVEEVLRQAAEILNEDRAGNWAPVTEERVTALFTGLAQDALAVALEMRVSQAETQLPANRGHGDWARKYRIMLAQSGQWPG